VDEQYPKSSFVNVSVLAIFLFLAVNFSLRKNEVVVFPLSMACVFIHFRLPLSHPQILI